MADLPIELIAPVVAAGVATAALGLGLGAWRARTSGTNAAPGWSSALAVGAVFFASQVVAFGGVPRFPPNGYLGWLPFIALAAVAAGSVEGALPAAGRQGLRVAVAGLAAYLVFRLNLGAWWPRALAMVGGVLVLAAAFGASAPRDPRLGRMLPIAVVTAGGAAAVASAGTLSVGQLAGSLAIVAGLALVAGLRWPGFRLSDGAVLPAATLTATCWAIGATFADLPWPAAAHLLVAPLAGLGVTHLAAVKRMPWCVAGAVEVAAMALPIAVAAGLAFAAGTVPTG